MGGNGIIGTGLSEKYHEKIILKTSRSEVNSWLGANSQSNIDKYFASFGADTTVINALGITDPKAPIEELELINSILPTRILSTINSLGMKLITFGTILEKNTTLGSVNSYVRTKQDFFNLIREAPPTKNHLHLQLHTIYGGIRSHKHMFIEQIFISLSNRTEFEMSSGFQVREYHHIEDEILAIAGLLESEQSGAIELSAGNAIQIRQLATKIFNEFGQLQLLNFNPALDRNDVFNHFYQRSPHLDGVSFRDPYHGVIEYLKKRLETS